MYIKDYIIRKIKDDLKNYTITPEIINEMENLYQNKESNPYTYIKSLLKIEFKNQILYCDIGSDKLGRKLEIVNLFKRASKNYKIPDITLYIITSDGYSFYHQHLPFLCLAKPMNKNGILFPDNTFYNHTIDDKNYDWEQAKSLITKKCISNKKFSNIYFRGANTGNKKHNLRYTFKTLTKKVPEFKIEISEKKIPIYTFCKYKYLLNLPGNQPWSYRFKYLFLMKSLVIDIPLLQKYGKEYNQKWINFYDLFLEENEDYISIPVKYDEKQSLDYENILIKVAKVYDYYQKNPKKYHKIVKSGYDKISKITNDVIDYTIVNLIEEYSNMINSQK